MTESKQQQYSDAIKRRTAWEMRNHRLARARQKNATDGLNQPCADCLAEAGTVSQNGFNRCVKCGEPSR